MRKVMKQQVDPFLVSVSTEDTRGNHTGSWRFLRPLNQDKPAPCAGACPAGNDIPRLLRLVREARFEEAYRLLKKTNPLPAICGRVCYHPCELACNRACFDEPASVRAIERFLADSFQDFREEPPPLVFRQRVAVVGSGPAGLSCAYFLARNGFRVRIFEAAREVGGMLRQGIPQYRLPRNVLDREIEKIGSLGVEFQLGTRIGNEMSLDDLLSSFDAVFVATGADGSRQLGVPGEKVPLVLSGLDFLRRVNRGDPPKVGSSVIVIGGGNTAMDAARVSRRLGAEPVVVYRRSRREMPADEEEVRQAEEEGIRLIFLASPTAFRKRGTQVVATFERMELGEPDASGRRRPVAIPGSSFEIAADTVLTAVGEEPRLDFLAAQDVVRLEEARKEDSARLQTAGLFLAGDARTGPATVPLAIRAGHNAALEIIDFFGNPAHVDTRRVQPETAVAGFQDINTAYFVHAPRLRSPQLPAAQRSLGFAEITGPLSQERARAEAGRCFTCGQCTQCENCRVFCPEGAVQLVNNRYLVNMDFCKGCGICAQECPRGVITLVQEEQ